MVRRRTALAALLFLGIAPPGLDAQQGPPFRLDQVERLLLAEVHGIIDDLRQDCIAFDLSDTNVTRLRGAGADNEFIEALRGVCQRIPQPAIHSTSACAVRALLDVVQVRAERREYVQAFETLARARDRVDALRTMYPGDSTWRVFGQEMDALDASVLRSCEAWRQIRLERGLPAPVCRSLPMEERP